MVLRAKNKELFHYDDLTDEQIRNSEKNICETDENKTVLMSKPRRIVLELTNACNLSCIMCGRNAWDFHLTRFKLEYLEKIKSLLRTAEEVTLMGWGEPTVHPQFEKILQFLNNYPVKKYFCTNGMRLDKLTDAIFENHVDIIAVSLDGADKETNDRIRKGANFDKILSNLKKIVEIKRERVQLSLYEFCIHCNV
ncbi:MAG TPA: radical SAM protein [Methanocorpusculum sp.]|nr:radical SAM protein [Methanocorpusculum sp.]